MPSSKLRLAKPGCAIAGFVALFIAMAMAVLVGPEVTAAWPVAVRSGWNLYLGLSLLLGVLLVVIGLGLLNRTHLRDEPSLGERQLGLRRRVGLYVGTLGVLAILGFTLQRLVGIPGGQTFWVGSGVILLVASTRRPWWLFSTIREFSFLAALADHVIRVLVFGLGSMMIVSGLFGS